MRKSITKQVHATVTFLTIQAGFLPRASQTFAQTQEIVSTIFKLSTFLCHVCKSGNADFVCERQNGTALLDGEWLFRRDYGKVLVFNIG
jgi:hypothetical protein